MPKLTVCSRGIGALAGDNAGSDHGSNQQPYQTVHEPLGNGCVVVVTHRWRYGIRGLELADFFRRRRARPLAAGLEAH